MMFAVIELGKIDILDLKESVWVKGQTRLLGKRKEKRQSEGRLTAGGVVLCCLSLGWTVQASLTLILDSPGG